MNSFRIQLHSFEMQNTQSRDFQEKWYNLTADSIQFEPKSRRPNVQKELTVHPILMRFIDLARVLAKAPVRRRRICLALLLAASFSNPIFAVEANEHQVPAPWANHPVLRQFSLDGKELPSELFLVRTRGYLPEKPGIVVHGEISGLYLVSGDPAKISALTRSGFSVTPLRSRPAQSRSASRQWTRLDTPDSTVEAMVAQVEWPGVSDKIQWLVDFGTRYSYAPNHYEVAESIGGAFSACGLQPVLSSFEYGHTTMWNVEATQTGTVYPDSFFIICGHFDSISESPLVSAPGADDNGTGVATVLTAAEILTQYEFEYSIRYVCFGGEEQGLRGSKVYAGQAAAEDLGIVGALNFDMMGYWEPGVEMDLEIETNQASQWLAAAIVNAAELYTNAPYELHVFDGAWWGDHASFWDEGYAAVNHEEAWDWGDPDFNPYYHTTSDIPVYLGPSFVVGNIKIGVAALATLAVVVPDVTDVEDSITPPSYAGSLRAYPNPFYGQVNFRVSGLTNREDIKIIVYDVTGRAVALLPIVLQGDGGTTDWNVTDDPGQNLGAGVYFVRVDGGSDISPIKILYIK
jgi:aminopeptidase YwaD